MTRALLVLVLALMPAAATAQHLEPVGALAVGAAGSQTPLRPPMTRQLGVRALLGVGSAFVGAYAGAFAAVSLPHSPCHCEDPGFDQAIYGAMVGAVLLPAIVSALPAMNSECSFGKRVMLGAITGIAGAAAGGVAGSSIDGAGVVFGYVGGAGLGAALGAGLCR
ncbi:MAG: hypothetical protein ABIY52_06925 [Gemmatimonadaceae bacterium]